MDDNADLKAKRYKLTMDPNFQPEQISDKTFNRWKNAFKTTLEGKSAVGPSHEHKELVEKPEPSNLNSDGLMLCENNFLENDNLSIEEVFCSSSDDNDDDDDDIDFPERNSQHEEQQLPDQKPSDCKTTFIEDGDKIMFKQSGITVKEVVEMVVAYNLRFGDSQEARQMLIEMIKIFAGPEFSNFNISNYSLSKIFDPPSEKIIYHFYCQKCTDKVLYKSCKKGIKGKKVLCETCKMEYTLTLSNPNYFVGIDLEYQLQMFLENEETAKYFIPKNTDCNSSKGNKNFMRDIDDSILHKSAIEKYAATITYLISTDGAPLFHISKRGFWPLQIILNNLPVHLRFKFVLLVGLMIVKNEPKPNLMNLFINAFIEQANHLHSKGMKVKIAHLDSEIEIHFTPSGAVADSVARPILQNRLQFNGYFGCSFCCQRGVFIFKIGLRYPFVSEEPELRSHTSHMKDIACAKEQGSFFQGVKGESAFIDLANIDMVWSFSLDYMHNAVLGVTEQIWKKWIKELTAEQRREIDKLLLLQKPPRDLHRSTEKIFSKSI
ncbi:uncharacterized protein LOC127291224 [Leptopilina boulardi]|uniref:uncharacterized protein LOC127291224 n=1 Tax=Leptopilina boulardi TaxID=63433 RepID=UPI0021F59308|nr:uncharacterized protein LOC127291224 [Leptopilina boulardi]